MSWDEVIEAFATGMQQAGERGLWRFDVESTDGESFVVLSAQSEDVTFRQLHILPRNPDDPRGPQPLADMLIDAGAAFARQARHA